jgi:malate synthase
MESAPASNGIQVLAPTPEEFKRVMTSDALDFIGKLSREFEPRRREILENRKKAQAAVDNGQFPDFLPETENIRKSEWKISPIPDDLKDRRVEITGPVDRKMIINALNSGASTYTADFEDSHSPTWNNTLQGQVNLCDAVNRTITYTTPEGKKYQLNHNIATLIVRPRGWHLVEKQVVVDGYPVSGGIFDFGIYFYHNVRELLSRGTGPYFYLPKMENHLEARLWNDIFVRAQDILGIPQGTIKATVLIETIPAAFEMDEIIYELRNHMAGLNCGRWDYIFSFIKRFRNVPSYLFPDRSQITMTRHCMHSYSLLAVKTCHRRGAHAIGGMAAQIPIKDDPEANEEALRKVREDKIREARDGHDGTWVAHPGLVAIAKEEFDREMPGPNQIGKLREDVVVTSADLLRPPKGTITDHGLWINVSVGLRYLAAWLSGSGSVPIYNLMEDAATAEISRTQLWQWVHHPGGILEDGRKITLELFQSILDKELKQIKDDLSGEAFQKNNYELAADLLKKIVSSPDLDDFLTIRAYEYLD